MKKYPLTYNPIVEYNDRIVNGKEVVSEKVKRVYKKIVSDLHDEKSEWFYDVKRANHAIEFIENFCKHSKGRLRRKTFFIRVVAESRRCYCIRIYT